MFRIQKPSVSCLVGFGIALIYFAFLPPAIYSIDEDAMVYVAESILTKGNFSVPSSLGRLGRDGNYYSHWYPLLSFLALPFVLMGAIVAKVAQLPLHYVASVSSLLLNSLLTSGTSMLIMMLSMRLGSAQKDACICALSFAFGTIAVVYTRTFFAEPLLAFLTIAGFYSNLFDTKKRVILTALFSGLAVLAKPTGMILGIIFSAYGIMKKRPLLVSLLPFLGMLCGIFLYGIYNYVRFGDLLFTGEPLVFNLQLIPLGFLGLLASPGRGLFWYCPPIILSFIVAFHQLLKSKIKIEAGFILLIFFAFLLLYSPWKDWSGGWSWGPRYLYPTLPLLMAIIGTAGKAVRKKLIILTLVGFILNVPTLISFYGRYYAEAGVKEIDEKQLLWVLEKSPLIHSWDIASRQIKDAVHTDIKQLMREAISRNDEQVFTINNSPALKIITLWWWVLPAINVSRWIGIMSACILAIAGAIFIIKALQYSERISPT